jgi:hypothetical protein
MKGKRFLSIGAGAAAAMAVAMAAALVLAGCDTGGGSGGGVDTATYKGTAEDGSLYTLTISKSPEKAYEPAKGDVYVLICGSNKSTGVVQSVDPSGGNRNIKLSPSKGSTFTTTVSNTGIIGFSGTTIKWDNGDDATLPTTVIPTNGGRDPTGLAGTEWFGRDETTTNLSYKISGSTFTWDHDRRYPAVLTKEGDPYSGGSLMGTVWSDPDNKSGYNKIEFAETTAKASWGPLDYMTYTLNGYTINFVYTRVREGTLTFKENSAFQFNDRNTQARGTFTVREGSITLNGVWDNGDAGAGTRFEMSGTVSGGVITFTDGVFWGIKIFKNSEAPGTASVERRAP